ncbi:L-aspartate dehydrogenase [Synergistales bacterium]|nr:L-aspartate dehydrogenase [Synergistales bacterium]
MKNVAIIGCGNLGSRIAVGIFDDFKDEYTLLGVLDRNLSASDALSRRCRCRGFANLEEMLESKPDYVVEAAASSVLKDMAIPVLQNGADLIVLSVGAFADNEFYAAALDAAKLHKRKIHIASGAIGGFDIMKAAMISTGGKLDVKIRNIKNPNALKDSPFLKNSDIDYEKPTVIFSGNALNAIRAFPQNVNVAVALAIATVGVENTHVEVESVPGKADNTHSIELKGDFGRVLIETTSAPSPENPKSSIIAAYSVLAKLKNLNDAITYG